MAAGLAFSRAPDDAERKLIAQFVDSGGSLENLCLALLNTNAFLYVD
jgi:hypothetical protein